MLKSFNVISNSVLFKCSSIQVYIIRENLAAFNEGEKIGTIFANTV